MKSILDPTFKYTPSVQTDLRKTFERIRREQRINEAALAAEHAESEARVASVAQIFQRRREGK